MYTLHICIYIYVYIYVYICICIYIYIYIYIERIPDVVSENEGVNITPYKGVV